MREHSRGVSVAQLHFQDSSIFYYAAEMNSLFMPSMYLVYL